MTPEEQRQADLAADRQQCAGFGYAEGTDAFAQCMQTASMHRDEVRLKKAALAQLSVFEGGFTLEAAEATLDIASADELYITGLHLDQYRHATRCATLYWREALQRDPLDARCNNAMGLWHLKRGEFVVAEKFFRKSIERLTRRNSNPYDGERKAGYIGKPLAGVKVRLVDDEGNEVKGRSAGEIQIKGNNVFLEYWRRPEATQKAFTEDGWFKTGDVAVKEKGYYRILGRDSIDIIKSGGYKISALEIEEVLRTHPAIKDCSVIGIPNEEWGELVVAAIITDGAEVDLKELNTWIREKMPAYKTPRQYKIVDEFPRNAMGKVTKNDLKPLFL